MYLNSSDGDDDDKDSTDEDMTNEDSNTGAGLLDNILSVPLIDTMKRSQDNKQTKRPTSPQKTAEEQPYQIPVSGKYTQSESASMKTDGSSHAGEENSYKDESSNAAWNSQGCGSPSSRNNDIDGSSSARETFKDTRPVKATVSAADREKPKMFDTGVEQPYEELTLPSSVSSMTSPRLQRERADGGYRVMLQMKLPGTSTETSKHRKMQRVTFDYKETGMYILLSNHLFFPLLFSLSQMSHLFVHGHLTTNQTRVL